jgi:hypothetical protein
MHRALALRTHRRPLMTATGFAHSMTYAHKLLKQLLSYFNLVFNRRCCPSHLSASAGESRRRRPRHRHVARLCCCKVVCLSFVAFVCFVVLCGCSLAPMLGIMPCDVLQLAQVSAACCITRQCYCQNDICNVQSNATPTKSSNHNQSATKAKNIQSTNAAGFIDLTIEAGTVVSAPPTPRRAVPVVKMPPLTFAKRLGACSQDSSRTIFRGIPSARVDGGGLEAVVSNKRVIVAPEQAYDLRP